jgi:membrane associated rhomboid family serine protease
VKPAAARADTPQMSTTEEARQLRAALKWRAGWALLVALSLPFWLFAAWSMIASFLSGAQDCAGGVCNGGPAGAFIAVGLAMGLYSLADRCDTRYREYRSGYRRA